MSLRPSIVVHGGAGRVDAERLPACVAACRRAAQAGLDHLRGGGKALDAVQLAVRLLEEEAELNAGRGAVLTRDGTVELDAALMNGADLRYGAVAAVPGLMRPVDLARAVLDDGEHILLAGEAAWEFARERGFARDVAGELIVPRVKTLLAEELARREGALPRAPRDGGGTVGAVAVDARGHTAAATSTGGMTGKRRGRVGDSPLPGCGTYADDLAGAASATGHGERIARITLTRFVVDKLRGGVSAQEAADTGVAELAGRVAGTGGVICVDRRGHLGISHNTSSLTWAFGLASGDVDAGAHFPLTR